MWLLFSRKLFDNIFITDYCFRNVRPPLDSSTFSCILISENLVLFPDNTSFIFFTLFLNLSCLRKVVLFLVSVLQSQDTRLSAHVSQFLCTIVHFLFVGDIIYIMSQRFDDNIFVSYRLILKSLKSTTELCVFPPKKFQESSAQFSMSQCC